MKAPLLFVFAVLELPWQPGLGQEVPGKDPSYQLYLTQIAAAEAFLQLNKISTARGYLDACDPQFRDVEWHFLDSYLDQSAKTITPPGNSSFTTITLNPAGTI